MKGLDILNDFRVATPCPASWNAMKGDDRARFCGACEKHVYNLAAMTGPEVVDLIGRTEGRFCGRIYYRRDGTAITADCPVGRKAFASGRLHRVLTYGVLGLAFLATGAFARAAARQRLAWPPVGPGVTFSDWTDWALGTLGFGAGGIPGSETLGTMVAPTLGKIAPPTASGACVPEGASPDAD